MIGTKISRHESKKLKFTICLQQNYIKMTNFGHFSVILLKANCEFRFFSTHASISLYQSFGKWRRMSNLSLATFMGVWDTSKWIFRIKIENLHVFVLFWVYPKRDIDMKWQQAVLLLLLKTATGVAKNFRSCKRRSQLSVDIFMAPRTLLGPQKCQF